MRWRLFFIVLFLGSVAVSAAYSLHFWQLHYAINRHIDARFVALIAASVTVQMAAHYLRAFKSHYLLDKVRETDTGRLFKGLAVGYLFNSLLPLRLGEFIRAFYVGDALSISKTTVFMSIVLERLVDGLILGMSFIAAGLLIHPVSADAFMVMTRLGAGLLVLSGLLAVLIAIIRSENRHLLRFINTTSSIFNARIMDRMRLMAWSGIYGTRLMLSDQRAVMKYLAASVIMWLTYFISMALVVIAFFDGINPAKSWFAVQSTFAGVSTPAGPGYISTFQAIVSDLLHRIGIASADSFALFVWLIITVPISAVGLFVLVRQRFNQGKPATRQEALINKLYRDKDISQEFSHFLDAYFKGEAINRVLTQAELDGKFKLVKSFKGGSNAHTMLVWQGKKLVVKKITLPQFADKLGDQAQWLLDRDDLPHLPKVINQEKTAAYYYFDLAYRKEYFPAFDYIHSHTLSDSFKVLRGMLRFMNNRVYQPVPAADGRRNLLDYIEHKVLGKVNDTAAVSNKINQLLVPSKIMINGNRYDNLLRVVEKIKRNKQAMEELSQYSESPIHGDLTIDNLITSEAGDFLVIDPNNENQVSTPTVDYGKLYQSLHSGYEFLIQLTNCQVRDGRIDFEDATSHKYAELFQRVDAKLMKQLDPKDYRSIRFHEAVHYCRMLTYRASINPRTLPVFYATAVKLFNEFLEQYETPKKHA